MTLYNRYTDNILAGITPTGTAPSASYSLATFPTGIPSERILWGTNSISLAWTLSGALLGDILVVPMHNFTPGSTTVLSITNNNGFSANITIPLLQADGFPPTLIVDLTTLASAATRTASVWNLVVTTNGVNVQMGAAVAIYSPKRQFSDFESQIQDASVNYTENETHFVTDESNEYGTRYINDLMTATQQLILTIMVKNAGEPTVKDWFRANHGAGRPGMVTTPSGLALYGVWQTVYQSTNFTHNRRQITLTFDSLSKGKLMS